MGFVKSDLAYILRAVLAAEERARAQPPALSRAEALVGLSSDGDRAGEAGPALYDFANGFDPAPTDAWMRLYADLFDYSFEAADGPQAGARFIPLSPDHAQFDPGSDRDYLILQTTKPLFERADRAAPDDASPYAVHPSLLALLRSYTVQDGRLFHNGELLSDAAGGPPALEQIQRQSAEMLGLLLGHEDASNIPLLATDAFGALTLSERGRAQLVRHDGLVELDPAAPMDASTALRTGQSLPDAAAQLPFAQHNAAVADIKTALRDAGSLELLNGWLDAPATDLLGFDAEAETLPWSADRLFLAARFGAEMAVKNAAFADRLAGGAETIDEIGAADADDDAADLGAADPEAGAPSGQAAPSDFDLGFLAELARQAAAADHEQDPVARALEGVVDTPLEPFEQEVVLIGDAFESFSPAPGADQDPPFEQEAPEPSAEDEPVPPSPPDYDL